jgi:hypothetical protein
MIAQSASTTQFLRVWLLSCGVQGRAPAVRLGGLRKGNCCLGSVLDDPVDHAVLLFEAASAETARAFARADP